MPRRSSRAAPVRNPPRPVAPPPPPPAPSSSGGGSVVGSVGSAIADGMAFGTGSAIAHRAVDAIVGPRAIRHETITTTQAAAPAAAAPTCTPVGADACAVQSRAFQDCITSNGSDIGRCQFYLDVLNECRRGSGSMLIA